jgi:hypothetical protein
MQSAVLKDYQYSVTSRLGSTSRVLCVHVLEEVNQALVERLEDGGSVGRRETTSTLGNSSASWWPGALPMISNTLK